MSAFLRQFCQKSWAGAGTGVIVQHLPLMEHQTPFTITWLSDSGAGNRDSSAIPQATLPNGCDPSQPLWTPTAYAGLFADLPRQTAKQAPAKVRRLSESELLVSGLEPGDLAILLPRDEEAVEAKGVRADYKGIAWMVAPGAGDYRLVYAGGARPIYVREQTLPDKPGYDYVERVALPVK